MDLVLLGKLVLTASAIGTIIGVGLADISRDHVFDASWPAHARFHTAAHALLKISLAFVALWLVWLAPGETFVRVVTAGAVLALNWLTMLGAMLFPVDAEVRPSGKRVAGLPPVAFLFIGVSAVSAFGATLAALGASG